ncbi:MFS transporter [Streptomyces sp. NBC_01497]|uniref:MFS transporter n=1 Tax=Streptomyces sp. NBC_01497 TaxID=2903885 RepID=UPI002E32D133|nr:MFS transporter [Streptomyces sp. NBC_01497]
MSSEDTGTGRVDAAPGPQPRSQPPAEDTGRRRDVSLYWCGQTASAFGSVFTAIALPVVAVVQLHASPGAIGLISAATTAPVLLLGFPAGAFADRIARPRRALVLLDLLCAVAIGTVALGLASHVITLLWLVLLCLFMGATSTVSTSVYFLHLRQLVGADGIGGARARLQAGQYGAALVGRLLAGPATALLGAAAALSIDVGSYALSAVALLSMRSLDLVPREPGTSALATLRGALAGMRLFTGDAFHRALGLFVLVPAGTMAGVTALTGPFLLRDIRLPTAAYGLVFALSGLMGLAGSAAAVRLLRPERDPRRLMLAAFTAAVMCSLLLPLATGPLPLAAFCASLGIGLPIFFGSIANVALSSVLVTDMAEEVLGRSMAALQVCTAASALVGSLGCGLLGDLLGVRDTLWITAVIALVSMAVTLPAALRAIQRGAEAEAEPART